MCHLVIVKSYMVNRPMDLSKREVEVLCYRGCTGHCVDHECISMHYRNSFLFFLSTTKNWNILSEDTATDTAPAPTVNNGFNLKILNMFDSMWTVMIVE